MPKFPKSDGYKMKGFEYPGKSPLKVSDSDLVAAQAELDKQETQFRQPGWARAAYKVHKSWTNPFSSDDERDLEKKTNEALKHTPGYDGGVKAKSGGEGEKTESIGQKMGNVGDLQAGSSGNTSLPQTQHARFSIQSSEEHTINPQVKTSSSATPYRKSPLKQPSKVKTIKRGKYKGGTKEVWKKGDEGYAGEGRGVIIKDKDNIVRKKRGKAFRVNKRRNKKMQREINKILREEKNK